MKPQTTFAEASFEKFRKKTRREQFLKDIELVVPWSELIEVIEPHYPKSGGLSDRPLVMRECCGPTSYSIGLVCQIQLSRRRCMTRTLCASSDIDLGHKPVPDETTLCKFRHLLEEHNLAPRMFPAINHYLELQGTKVSSGTIVDATIINAPSSTENKDQKRDSDMHQLKKGNQWHFGIHSKTKYIHSVATSSANMRDSPMIKDHLHGDNSRVRGDSAYTGQREAILEKAPYAQDFTHRKGFGTIS